MIDAHVHVWDLRRRTLPWLPADHPLHRDFTLTDLALTTHTLTTHAPATHTPATLTTHNLTTHAPASDSTATHSTAVLPSRGLTPESVPSPPGMRGAKEPSEGLTPETAGLAELVLVQADADPGEVGDLLALARREPAVVGVVGWFDLLDFPDRLPDDPRLVGVRSPPVDQTDPDLMTDPAHVRGVRAAADAGLAIDLLLRPSALIGAARLASAVPDARLVLDHLGNPAGATAEWRDGMRALAEFPDVSVKLSGTAHLATADLRALVDVALELFGSERLLFGSDWPVCTLAGTRADVLRRTTALLPPATHNDVFRGTAQRIYRPRETAP